MSDISVYMFKHLDDSNLGTGTKVHGKMYRKNK